MKMMKKSGLHIAAVMLAALVALVMGCQVMPEGEQIPDGMALVKISFNEAIGGRAILPPDPTLGGFLGGFDLVFTGGGGPYTRHIDAGAASSASNNLVSVPAGTYTIEAIAYMGRLGSTGTAVASTHPAAAASSVAGTITGTGIDTTPGPTLGQLTVAIATPRTITINLSAIKPADSASGEIGELTWNITNNVNNLGSATITITEIDSTLDSPDATTLGPWAIVNSSATPGTSVLWNNASDANALQLAPGYYFVTFTLTTTGASGSTRSFQHIVHVYQNMRSGFSYTFTDAHMGVTGGSVTAASWTYTHVDNHAPTLSVTGTTGSPSGDGAVATPITLALTPVQSVTFTVAPGTDTYDSWEWFVDGVALNLDSTTLTITTDTTAASPAHIVSTVTPMLQVKAMGILRDDGLPYDSDEMFVKIEATP